jgi:transposase
MIPMPAGTQIWVACGTTDMRKGFDGLAMLVQDVLKKAAHICGGTDYVAAGALEPLGSTKSAGSPPHNI